MSTDGADRTQISMESFQLIKENKWWTDFINYIHKEQANLKRNTERMLTKQQHIVERLNFKQFLLSASSYCTLDSSWGGCGGSCILLSPLLLHRNLVMHNHREKSLNIISVGLLRPIMLQFSTYIYLHHNHLLISDQLACESLSPFS